MSVFLKRQRRPDDHLGSPSIAELLRVLDATRQPHQQPQPAGACRRQQAAQQRERQQAGQRQPERADSDRDPAQGRNAGAAATRTGFPLDQLRSRYTGEG